MTGRVYLVGAGCGDYDLITLRGMELLRSCDTVVYDALIDQRLLSFVPENAEKICVGKRSGRHSETQENINRILVEKAQEGRMVVRLKGGDPLVFGRGGEEAAELKKHGIYCGFVPGVTSAAAVPELAGIPVTHRGASRSFHVITGHTGDGLSCSDFRKYAGLDGTLVFLMGLKKLPEITAQLLEGGMAPDTPAAVVSKGGTPEQRVIRSKLESIAESARLSGIEAPAVTVIGRTAEFNLLPDLPLPLSGVKVAVTGTERFRQKLSDGLKSLGAETYTAAALEIQEYRENPELDKELLSIEDYSWVVFTSGYGADIFFRRMKELRIDMRSLADVKFAVIGSGTGEITEKYGIIPDLVPESFTAAELGRELCRTAVSGEKVLLPRAELASEELADILREKGLDLREVKIYNTVSRNAEKLPDCQYTVFGSSSAVRAYFTGKKEISAGTKPVCIGEVTAAELKKFTDREFLTAQEQTVQGIIRTILEDSYEQIQETQDV